VNESEELLRRLTQSDEGCLRSVLSPIPELTAGGSSEAPRNGLDRRTRGLVLLAALLALDAPPASMRWAVDAASTTGVDDSDFVAVLVASAAAAGAAQAVAGAEDLALAIGYTCVERSGAEQPGLARSGHSL
jgi:alkylhydroperoxidase/carboxymuconolactone decarboxylase family protein YurZ